jgi:hypothetical protein
MMLSFRRPILLISVETGDVMCYAKWSEELIVKFLIFPTPIRLNTFNFCVKEPLNMSLELHEDALSISSVSMRKIHVNLLKS